MILLYITLVLFIQLFYLFYFFQKLNQHKKSKNLFFPDVSVIICAKNEAKNLKKNLPVILNQNYTNYEVIVVDDQSNDETKYVLKDLKERFEKLKIVTIEDNVHHRRGKKFALTLGIKTAKFEYVLLTDADCIPNSKRWISEMIQAAHNKDIVLGYSNYEKKKGILNKLIRFDTFIIGANYLSFVLTNQTYMGVGRNLCYKKSIFFNNKGFASHIHLPSGDDDLFIQEVAKAGNTTISIHKDSHTTSEVIEEWKLWMNQKRRHITTSSLYKPSLKILLLLFPLSQLSFWIITIFMLQQELFFALIIALVIKFSSSYIVYYHLMRKLDVRELYILHPFYEILNIIIQGFFVLLNILNKPKNW